MFYNPDWIIHGNYNAARKPGATYEILDDNKELRVMGKEVDCVENLPLANLTAYKQEETVSNRIPGWKKSCGVGFSLSKYPTGESVREAVWRTLSWNTDDGDGYPARAEHGKHFEDWYRILMSDKDFESIVTDLSSVQTNPFQSIINSTAPLCTTTKGYLASVPHTAQTGDCIAVLTGGETPFVLRPTGDHYRFIGLCYVHGIMDGQSFPEDPSEMEWFSIR
jgi:hypothetical protein